MTFGELTGKHLREQLARCAGIKILRRRARSQGGFGASGGFAREFRGFGGNRDHLRQIAVAMKHNIAACRQSRAAALGNSAGESIHRHVVAHQKSLEPDQSANHLPQYCDGSGGRRDGVYRTKHNMCGHPEGQVSQRHEGRKIRGFERRTVGLDDG